METSRAALLEGGGLIVMLRPVVDVTGGDSPSEICTVKLDVPTEVGVPEITPLVPFNVMPAGKLP